MTRRREAWLKTEAVLDPARLLFIDETGVTTKMARRYGRAKRGKRCQCLGAWAMEHHDVERGACRRWSAGADGA